MSDYNRSPIVNPIPTSILLIFFGIILVEAFLIFGFGGPLGKTETTIERLTLVQNYGVPPNLATWMFETGNFSIDYVSRFIVYPFINLSGLSVVFAALLFTQIPHFGGSSPSHSSQICGARQHNCLFLLHVRLPRFHMLAGRLHRIRHNFSPRDDTKTCFGCIDVSPETTFWWAVSIAFDANLVPH